MREIINYILEANIALLAFLAAYKLLLKNENSFVLLRAYLLCAILFSLAFPLIHFQNSTPVTTISIGSIVPEYWLPEINIGGPQSNATAVVSPATETWTIVGWVYLSGVMLASLWLICQVGYVIILMANSRSYKIQNFRIIESSEDKPTFSFFNLIYIGKSNLLDPVEKEQIIKHESIHARQLHSLDMLLVTLVKNFFWFNPFIKTYKELFIQVHEFEADARAVENSDVNKYCSLLARVALQSHFPIASHFNESLTVKRIEMMRTIKKKIEKWKIAAVLVIVAGCFVAISCNDQLVDEFEKSTISQTNEMPAEVKLQMDNYIKDHPGSKLTYMVGTSDDMKKFVSSPEVKSRVLYEYAFSDDEKKGVLLTDVVQHAESLQTNDKVFMVVEQQPEYAGGFDAMMSFLKENIRYPLEDLKANRSGTVYISMVINEDGQVTDPKLLRGISASIDAEALRVVKMMPPWTPGKQNGKNVKVRFNIPIKFHGAQQQGQYYEYEKPSPQKIEPANYKMKLIQFGKRNGSEGERILVGNVTDESDKPLSGLTVLIAGTTTGTQTDANGKFQLRTKLGNGKLVLSHIGFDSKTIEF